jgi:hypothetical protein
MSGRVEYGHDELGGRVRMTTVQLTGEEGASGQPVAAQGRDRRDRRGQIGHRDRLLVEDPLSVE